MEIINFQDGQVIRAFRKQLEEGDGPDDWFPPDSGVREPDPDPTSPQSPPQELGAMAVVCAVSTAELIAA